MSAVAWTFIRLRLGTLAVAMAAAAAAQPANTLKVTNHSQVPWCLRIIEEPDTSLQSQGRKETPLADPAPKGHELVYCLPPGEACVLQFKEPHALPILTGLGGVEASSPASDPIAPEPLVASLPPVSQPAKPETQGDEAPDPMEEYLRTLPPGSWY